MIEKVILLTLTITIDIIVQSFYSPKIFGLDGYGRYGTISAQQSNYSQLTR